jgi:integrase
LARRGNVRKRGDRWYGSIEGPRKPDGKRTRLYASGATRRAVEEELTRLGREVDTGVVLDLASITVGEYLDEWVAWARLELRPTTAEGYAGLVKNQLRPAFGHYPLRKLTTGIIQRAYSRWAERYKPRSVRAFHVALHAALERAIELRLIPHNPADHTARPRVEEIERDLWTPGQRDAFLASVAGSAHEALWLTMIWGGLRRGEVIALRWSSVDLEGGTLLVRERLAQLIGGGDLGKPKSKAGLRLLAMPASWVAVMRLHAAVQGEAAELAGPAWEERGLCFPGPAGKHLGVKTIDRRLRMACRRAGVPRLTPHELRHLNATRLMELGVADRVIAERLGHSDPAITRRIYQHVSLGLQREAVERLAGDGA